MQGSAWVSLLRLLPPEHLDKLILITVNGIEIYLQGILRTDPEYLTVRGRLAASTEGGRVFFLPYDQICLIGFRDGIPEAKVQEMLGAAPAGSTNGLSHASDAALPADANAASPVSESSKSSRTSLQPAKAALLERLRRARSGQDTPK
jgi:hypothetical protein